jgi:uncharacterized protein DUF3830
MSKEIVLTCEGVSVVARLLEDEAPLTVRKFWDALPFDEPIRQARRSGATAYFISPKMRDHELPFENRVSFYTPGTLNLKAIHGEVCIPYGQAQARTVTGNEYATQFAKLLGDYEPFLAVVGRLLTEGRKQLTIVKREG